MDCYPRCCHCPQTPIEVLMALQMYLSDMKSVLTDKEKAFVEGDIEELKKRYDL